MDKKGKGDYASNFTACFIKQERIKISLKEGQSKIEDLNLVAPLIQLNDELKDPFQDFEINMLLQPLTWKTGGKGSSE